MKISRLLQLLLLMVTLIVFLTIASSVTALPTQQGGFPCFGNQGCPELTNPEEGEYYSVQCTTNSMWIWRSLPTVMLVALVPLFQVDILGDEGSLVVAGDVTVTRSGDTITLSGENGNFAPQPGEKSFSWNECIELNGGLPELPPVGQELTDEQIACLNLPTEPEVASCLETLDDDPVNSILGTCADSLYRDANPYQCGGETVWDRWIEVIFLLTNWCRFPGGIGAAIISFAAFSRWRRRK